MKQSDEVWQKCSTSGMYVLHWAIYFLVEGSNLLHKDKHPYGINKPILVQLNANLNVE
jgi:hypothetical protein